MQQPALIFDFGNVLAGFDYTRAFERLGRPRGLDGPGLLAKLRVAGFDGWLKRYESGSVDCQTFASATAELAGWAIPPDEFAAAWADIFTLNQEVADLAAELGGRGYRLVLGSNTNPIHARHFRRQFAEALAPFHSLVFSFEVGQSKPAAAFYQACARAAGREPADCVFIDDLAENVDGARAAGLAGLVFSDVERLRDDLAGLGIGGGR